MAFIATLASNNYGQCCPVSSRLPSERCSLKKLKKYLSALTCDICLSIVSDMLRLRYSSSRVPTWHGRRSPRTNASRAAILAFPHAVQCNKSSVASSEGCSGRTGHRTEKAAAPPGPLNTKRDILKSTSTEEVPVYEPGGRRGGNQGQLWMFRSTVQHEHHAFGSKRTVCFKWQNNQVPVAEDNYEKYDENGTNVFLQEQR